MPHDSRITTDRQEEILENARAAARRALSINDPTGLTALGRAYYDVYKETK